MRAWRAWLCCLPGLLLLGCDSTNPVEPPPPATGGSSFTVTLSSQQSSLTAGSTTGVTITVTAARAADGAPPADGTEVAVNTNLGNFGVDPSGNPVQTTTVALTGGRAQVVFFAGASPGTANILAQLGDSAARLNIAISDPGTPPVAGFSFTTNGLQALFTDSSTGDPTAWSWSFGDGQTSAERSPLHTYADADTYVVELTVTNAAGSNSTRKFVTVDPVANPLMAGFTVSTDGLTAIFTDTSAGSPDFWDWDFGDGSDPVFAQNPSHAYAAAGTYTVTLAIANATGQNASTSKFVTVAPPGTAPSAAFTVAFDGLTAIFTDTSTGSGLSWSWSFGDGSAASTAQNPSHTYAAAGTYRATLTVTNDLGSDSTSQVFTVPPAGSMPTAAFTFQASGLQVAFMDASTGSPTSWQWDFGDGSAGSTERNPVHGYAESGTYTVELTVANASGTSSVSQFVDVPGPLEASFEFSINGLTVLFTDTSTGSPTAWQWDFGDGASSTAQNPSHAYTAAGSYTVTLTVRRGNESVFERRTVTVAGG
jgi:PKD repeat protein